MYILAPAWQVLAFLAMAATLTVAQIVQNCTNTSLPYFHHNRGPILDPTVCGLISVKFFNQLLFSDMIL